MHSGAQFPSVPLRNAGDQVGGPGKCQRGRKAIDNRDDLPLQTEQLQGFINRSLLDTATRDADMAASSVGGGSDLTSAERMSLAHHTNETVPEQRLYADLRASRLSCYRSLEIDRALAKWRAVLVGLPHEAEAHTRRLLADTTNEVRSEIFNEAVAGSDSENSNELLEVEPVCGAKNGLSVFYQLTDLLAELERAGCGNETSSGPDQQGIARRLTQPRQRPAHRRRAEPQPSTRASNTAFSEQHIKGDEQIEVRC